MAEVELRLSTYKDDVHGCTSVPEGYALGVRVDMESKKNRILTIDCSLKI